MKVGVVQFIKAAPHRRRLSSVASRTCSGTYRRRFHWETQGARDVATAEAAREQARAFMRDPAIGLVVLDELNMREVPLSRRRHRHRRPRGAATMQRHRDRARGAAG